MQKVREWDVNCLIEKILCEQTLLKEKTLASEITHGDNETLC